CSTLWWSRRCAYLVEAMQTCKKCNFVNESASFASISDACPRCGAIYAKVDAFIAEKAEKDRVAAEVQRIAREKATAAAQLREIEKSKKNAAPSALVPCPACGVNISPSAITCPQCGHPRQQPRLKKTTSPLTWMVVILICLTAISAAVSYRSRTALTS